MLILNQRRTKQPPANAKLAEWLPRGSLVYVPGQPLHGDALGAEPFGARFTVEESPYIGGIGLEGSAATSSRLTLGSLNVARSDRGMTWVAQLMRTTDASRWVSGTVGTGTTYREDFAVNADQTLAAAAGKTACWVRNTSGGGVTSAASTNAVLTSGQLHTVVWRFYGGSNVSLWVDGDSKPVTFAASGSAITADAVMEFPLVFLNANVRNSFASGGSGLKVSLYARITTGAVPARDLSAEPFGLLFAQRRIMVPVGVAPAFKPAWVRRSSPFIGAGVR